MPTPTDVPQSSFLGAYAVSGAFTDCYATPVSGVVELQELVEAFYTTPLFKVERWLLATALGLHSTDEQARMLASGHGDRFSAWRVESRSESEILLDAGQTRSWLSVAPTPGLTITTTLMFGSAVVPIRPGGKFGVAFHVLLGFHRLYSKLLLAAAARRVVARRGAQGAA
jgi:hypothetical protein